MSHRALSPEQFKVFPANPREMGGVPHHTVEAWAPEHAGTEWAQARPEERNQYAGSSVDPGHRPIGSISWHHKTGEIRGVYVEKEHQRQGVATALLGQARQTAAGTRGITAPRHSPDRTASGEAWARSTGDRLPALRPKP
jgi:GNAT superfamily N-acetyltransferase